MTSEIRANTLKNRVGLGTVSFTNTGPVVSGIVTANSFSGPLITTSIDLNGDLDVDGHTNLDNVSIAGVVTATTFVGNGDFVELDVDGHTNLDNVSIAGVSTVTTFLQVFGVAGTSDRGLEVRSNSTQNTNTNQAIRIRNNSNTDTFNISYRGKVTATEIDLNGDLDVDGHTNLDNVSIAGVSTFSNNVKFDGATAGRDVTFIRSSNTLEFASNAILELGNGGSGDCRLFNNGTDTRIINGNGTLKFESDTHEFKDKDNTTSYLSITSSGAVMINTTNSSSRTLNLKGTFGILSASQTGVLDMSVTDGGEASIGPYVAGGSALVFKTNSSGSGVAERLRIDSTGRVLIGSTLGLGGATSSPSGLLHCQTASGEAVVNILGATNGVIQLSGYNGDSTINFGDSSSGSPGQINYDHGTDSLAIKTGGGSNRMIIDSSGNVMIGRTVAQKKFSVRETSNSSGVYYNAHIGGASHLVNYAIGIGFDPEGYEARTKMALVAEGISQGYSRGKFHFLLDAANDSGEASLSESRMTITDAGRVGINETSPDGNLHIKSSNPAIYLEDSTGSSQHGQAIIEQNGDNLKIRQDAGNASSGTASNISLQVDAFERLKIASSGALTNTTNSSHSQGAGTFNIKGVISQYSQGSGSGLIFDCDFGRLTGYGDDNNVNNGNNLSAALAHSTTDWTSSSSTTPMTVNGGTFQYRVGFGGYMEGISNGGRVLVTAGSGSPNMADKLNTAAMTIECWCWYDGTDREVLVSRYGSGFPNNFNMLTDPNGQFHYNSSGAGAGSGNVSGEHFPDKTWHHHLWQYESGVHRWYINGAFANSRTGGSSVAVSSSTGFGIFSRADDYERFRGKIAIVRIYNRALSAAEIKNHFELERGRFGV